MFTLVKNIAFFIPFFFACSHAQLLGFTKLKDMNCEELTKASNNKDFALKSLAGIRGIKKCPGFAYDIKSVSEFDRKIYAQEITEANFILSVAAASGTASGTASASGATSTQGSAQQKKK